MTLHPAPDADGQSTAGWRVMTGRSGSGPMSRWRNQDLQQTSGKYLARARRKAGGADEPVLLNTNGEVVRDHEQPLLIQGGIVSTPR